MKKLVLSCALLAALSACAQAPGAIQPTSMGNAFAEMSCQDAATMLNAENANLVALTEQQNNARAGDAIGVFLVLIPVGSLTGGDVAGDIAATKGKIQALEARLATCNVVRS